MAYQETPYQKINIVDADGNIISIGGGSGGGGDASAANQQSQITIETAIRDRIGSTSVSGATMPTGGAGLFGWLSAIYLFLTQTIPALVNGRIPVDGSAVTQPVSLSSVPLASNAATDTTLQQVRDAIKATIDLATSIWTDNSGSFYVRRDSVNEGTGSITVSFTDPTGNAATPGAGLRPLSTTDKDTITDFYDVLTSGTGYSVGDLLARVAILDANSGSPSATFIWINLSQGTILGGAPTVANIERANENVGARQVGAWNVAATLDATNSGYLSNLNTAIGTPVTGATIPTGGAGWLGWLSAIWLLINNKIPALGQALSSASTPVVLPASQITALTPLSTINVTSGGFISTATIQRAANVTPYTANDVYGAAFSLPNIVGVANANIILTSIDIIFNISAIPAGMSSFVLYLYSVTPPSAIADNGAFSLPSGDRASILTPTGVSLGSAALATGGGTVVLEIDNLNLQFAPASTSLFGYLVTSGAFTPAANSETATIRARVLIV
ncbi:hypothetical protein [uncultured Nostoc sp.]|uniref:hypothetical protein n=1 Tax=uncultured Nostoc sp. TaxID=340711 RepID=UPI0035CAB2C9